MPLGVGKHQASPKRLEAKNEWKNEVEAKMRVSVHNNLLNCRLKIKTQPTTAADVDVLETWATSQSGNPAQER